MKNKFLYQCSSCEREYDSGSIMYLCPKCEEKNRSDHPPKGILKVLYDYKHTPLTKLNFQQLKQNRWLDLLPINSLNSLPNLRIGNTPIYKITHLENNELDFELYIKDDSQNPTFSFKDRASSIVSAFARENGLDTIIAASTGNAGSSLAGICASQSQKAIILVPESAPVAKLTQIIMYGATIIPVRGTYDDAFDLSVAATEKFGLYNRNTAYNPLTIEGKKTVSYELFDQFEEALPHRIFIPVGDGVIISGVYKGFEDLLKLGFINKVPIIIAVQSSGSDNLVRNLDNNQFDVKESHTLADSISVDYPRNFYMTKDYLKKYHGEWITVSDDEIIDASKKIARNSGVFTEPAAAAAFAGLLKYKGEGKIPYGSINVVLLTGSGLKDIKSLEKKLSIPKAVAPDIGNIDPFL